VVDATDDKDKLLRKIFLVLTIPVFISIVFMIPGYKALEECPLKDGS